MTLNDILSKYGKEKLNTLTKYPSILTYHVPAEKGVLRPFLAENKSFPEDEQCFITEKLDGANSRIIVFDNDYIIGSRILFLYAKGDRFGDPTLNIVNTVKPYAEIMAETLKHQNKYVYVIFGETYGGNITLGSANYTIDRSLSFRVFDIVALPLKKIETLLSYDIEKIMIWRENKNTYFKNVDEVKKISDECKMTTVPYMDVVKGSDMPVTLEDTHDWLKQYYTTRAGINNHGMSEGVVVRTKDRKLIRKIRINNYEKTINGIVE